MFKENNSAKTPFLVTGPFSNPPILFVVTLAFDREVMYGNIAFSIVVPLAEKQ